MGSSSNLLLSKGSDNEMSFYVQCFAFTANKSTIWTHSTLDAGSSNLSPAQKELLLWHHQTSHAELSTIHDLLQVKKTPSICSWDESIPLCRGGRPPLLMCHISCLVSQGETSVATFYAYLDDHRRAHNLVFHVASRVCGLIREARRRALRQMESFVCALSIFSNHRDYHTPVVLEDLLVGHKTVPLP